MAFITDDEKTKCVFDVLASSFVCHIILEEDQGYGGNKPTAGYGSPDLGKACKPMLLPLLLATTGCHASYHEILSSGCQR